MYCFRVWQVNFRFGVADCFRCNWWDCFFLSGTTGMLVFANTLLLLLLLSNSNYFQSWLCNCTKYQWKPPLGRGGVQSHPCSFPRLFLNTFVAFKCRSLLVTSLRVHWLDQVVWSTSAKWFRYVTVTMSMTVWKIAVLLLRQRNSFCNEFAQRQDLPLLGDTDICICCIYTCATSVFLIRFRFFPLCM